MSQLAAEVQAIDLYEALHSLHRLTATEVAVAGVRAMQARDPELRRELLDNREKGRQREVLIAETLRKVGGIPTPFSPAVGKVIAVVRAQLDSAATFTSALVGDIALETTLLERARFTRRLAERLGEPEVVRLCEGLEAAHTETIAWLRARLDEIADTGRSRLRPLPTQVAVGLLRKAALLPVAALNHRARQAAGMKPSPRGHEAYPTATGDADVRGAATIS